MIVQLLSKYWQLPPICLLKLNLLDIFREILDYKHIPYSSNSTTEKNFDLILVHDNVKKIKSYTDSFNLILNYFNFEVEFIENLNLPVFIYKDRDSDNINYLTCYEHTKNGIRRIT